MVYASNFFRVMFVGVQPHLVMKHAIFATFPSQHFDVVVHRLAHKLRVFFVGVRVETSRALALCNCKAGWYAIRVVTSDIRERTR